MEIYWDNKYREIKTQWGFEPSDSAIRAKDFFIQNNINDILIPGVGFGRNAGIFLENGINVTGIEISGTAINMAREMCHYDFQIYHGSVTGMPFDQKLYGGIFCYALIHLLNKPERIKFIQSCYNQLRPGGYMIFIAVSKKSDMYGKGRLISTDRFEISKGLKVYFYDTETATNEFKKYGLIEVKEIDEPVKHMVNEPPMKLIMIKCKL